MKFSREAARRSGQTIIVACVTPAEKAVILKLLETTLKLEYRSGAGHPLEDIIELQIHGLDTDSIAAAREALESDAAPLNLTRQEFGTITRLANVWDERKLAELDKEARDNEQFLARYPAMRAYVLSEAFQDEIKPFAGVVSDLCQAHREIYPHDRTVIEVDFGSRRIAKR